MAGNSFIWRTCVVTVCCIVMGIYAEVDSSLVIDGDLIIAGLFKLETAEGGDCGDVDVPSVLSMEAVRWYLNAVNTWNLPFKVGFRFYKTCESTDVAREHAVDILERYRQSTSTNTSEDFIIGVIGPELSSESTAVSSMLSSQPPSDRFLQISYSATSTELNNRQLYPNFYRVIPDDKVQIEAMVKLMLELEWNRVSILFENDTYGRVGAEDLQGLALDNNICVSRMDAINIDSSRRVDVTEIKRILEEIVIQSPQVTGVVYFGSMTVANTIFRIVEKQDYNNVPIFLISESIQLQNNAFYSTEGTELTKPRGAMTVAPPMITTAATNDFWNSITSTLTSTQAFLEASQANPYLNAVVSKYNTSCGTHSTNCYPLNQEEVNRLKDERSPYIHYALKAANTLVETVRRTCTNIACTSANDLKQKFKPRIMTDAINGLSVDFYDGTGSFIDTSPNIQHTNSGDEYDVYNYRTSIEDDTKFKFVRVGQLSDNHMLIEKDKLRDYDADGREMAFPNLRRGACPEKNKCQDCLRTDLTDVSFHIPGTFYIIGIASINNRAIPGPLGCGTVRTRHGYQMYLSMKFALAEFQSRRSFTQYNTWFGNNTIGLVVINSCNNELEIVRRILDLHTNGLRLQDGTFLDLTDRILGYIGGQSTDVSEPAARQLTKLNFVQISYSSTNPVLSNKVVYPYFMRIITPDNVQAKAMIAIVKELDGKYIQLVYSEGAYGEGGRDAVVEEAKKNFICIAQETKVLESDNYHKYYEIMRKKPHAKIVIIFLRSHVVQPFLRDVQNSKTELGEFQFIGSEAWGTNTNVLQYDIVQGAILVSVEMDTNRDLEEYLQGQVPTFMEPNPWLLEYIQNRQDCYFRWSFDKTFSRKCTEDILPTSDITFQSDPWCIFAFNTLLSFLKGSATFFKDRCGSFVTGKLCSDYVNHPDDLVEIMKKVKMNIYGDGDIFIYDNQGDGLMGYKIFNIQTNPDDKSKRMYSPVGSFSLTSGLVFDVNGIKYPTLTPMVSSCPSESACTDCKETHIEPAEQTESPNITVPIVAAIGGVLVIIIIVLVVCLIKLARIKPNDTYITPQHLEERQSADGNYHHSQGSGGSEQSHGKDTDYTPQSVRNDQVRVDYMHRQENENVF